jgi:hypothetical protein
MIFRNPAFRRHAIVLNLRKVFENVYGFWLKSIYGCKLAYGVYTFLWFYFRIISIYQTVWSENVRWLVNDEWERFRRKLSWLS